MDFFSLIQTRHSIRSFQKRSIEEEKIKALLNAINSAPSAGNIQAYEVYLVTAQDKRDILARAAWMQEFIATAPIVLAFCTHSALSEEKYGKRGAQLYAVQDATIACTYAMLAAVELGLSSVWVGAFNDEAVKTVLDTAEGLQPVALLPIGYADESPSITSRRPIGEIIHHLKP
jgi:nitroreductase